MNHRFSRLGRLLTAAVAVVSIPVSLGARPDVASASPSPAVVQAIVAQATADAGAHKTYTTVKAEAVAAGVGGDFAGTSSSQWCSGYARSVWHRAGALYTNELTAYSGSFYNYGVRHGTLHGPPARVGDAVVYGTDASHSDHVGIVTAVGSTTFTEVDGNSWSTATKPSATYVVAATKSLTNPTIHGGATHVYGYISPVTPAPSDPIGSLDLVSSPRPGTVRVYGWSFDRSSPAVSSSVHVYVGGPAGSGEGHNLGAAAGSRPDVGAAYPGAGSSHGYDVTFTTAARGTTTVWVYGIDIDGNGTNQLIGTGTVTIGSPDPTGSLDLVSSPRPGTVRVYGWSFDRSSPAVSSSVHVYVGGPAGSGEGHNLGAAAGSRPDVGAAYPGAGSSHGYDVTFTTAARGTTTVWVYGIDIDGNGTNQLIGTRTVTIG